MSVSANEESECLLVANEQWNVPHLGANVGAWDLDRGWVVTCEHRGGLEVALAVGLARGRGGRPPFPGCLEKFER